MYSGYSLGILGAALVAIAMLPGFGWRSVLWIGVVPVLFVPVLMIVLPESIAFLLGKGRIEEARRVAAALSVDLPPGSSAPAVSEPES